MSFNTLSIFGTRPEAIKMAPLIRELQCIETVCSKVCVTGQHQQMLDSVLDLFEITPDFNLQVMEVNQDLSSLTAKILLGLSDIFKTYKPDLILVHGDTTTTLAASLSAYYHRIPVAHVEAGLRSGNMNSPWPEEANRKLAGGLASMHFVPTELARLNLLNEGVNSDSIYLTGNTVVDALYSILDKIEIQPDVVRKLHEKYPFFAPEKRMILVTGHRRENFGQGFQNICCALKEIAQLFPDVDIVYPVHLNPNVQKPVNELLGAISNIHLIAPIDYLPFVYFMKSAYIILTDSGGIQEEAPSLGKPVLVMRETTERPEAVNSGVVKLVGTNTQEIVAHVKELLINTEAYQRMSQVKNPYGDGFAAVRIGQIIYQLSNKNALENKLSDKEIFID
ncbi:UDP-N-acetylglucosamine 2-epimerase (non-hydrolyzing) [Legionella qingyii]|uniref:UDP-N-acetylglucosamine 2-epimerase (non-hydrolyzing) n=1 Tax=Legionella qingyii TaxID=2184757 RepID=A0A317U3K5_9GAMM|nr:UDP-N-acetylglucosamine 2-epimerase (non-hydrolyzing) [Legionella qingyii]PWY56604.1 UDP-N-acetylglucosamine 2-epimerase (non-hydrolyzing) [Legionella qingyii]RUR23417.1 UDP-N-acetylglucosamine 2-epimerase (non-hydrolyzing) [Legionella qingyii]RUR26136.1 UDP-N-acetylglucosamine 2-epimerase (non-hydrolyzing) [Legionella qingyii]